MHLPHHGTGRFGLDERRPLACTTSRSHTLVVYEEDGYYAVDLWMKTGALFARDHVGILAAVVAVLIVDMADQYGVAEDMLYFKFLDALASERMARIE